MPTGMVGRDGGAHATSAPPSPVVVAQRYCAASKVVPSSAISDRIVADVLAEDRSMANMANGLPISTVDGHCAARRFDRLGDPIIRQRIRRAARASGGAAAHRCGSGGRAQRSRGGEARSCTWAVSGRAGPTGDLSRTSAGLLRHDRRQRCCRDDHHRARARYPAAVSRSNAM